MKKIYALFVLLATSASFNVMAQNFQWANRGGLWAYDYGYGICTDNAGNVYVTGKYEENADFNGTILPCQGNHDIYLAQYSPTGTLNWIQTAGGTLGDYGTSVACDGSNYVYIAGEIEGYNVTVSFVGTPTTLTSVGANDIFLAKYDLSGTLQWAQRAGGVHNEKALGVTYDNAGNVYICGFFTDTATFGGTTIYGSGMNDIYVAKYDMNGNFLWVRQAGSSGRDEAKGIKCDALGNVYICGMMSGSCSFGQQVLVSPNGYYDSFVAKYASDGTLKWAKNAGGNYDEVAWGITMDNLGKIYIAGEFNASADFDNIQLITTGNADVFVACYDTLGGVVWAVKGGGAVIDRARGIGSDGTNIYITGQFGSSAGFGNTTVSAADSSDVFMAALNSSGTFLWANSVNGIADTTEPLGYESGNAICADATGSVYATGSMLDGGIFGGTTLAPFDRTDVFITKITQGPDVTSPLVVTMAPVDNAVNVPNNTNLVLTFNEAIQKGAGSIVIKENGVITQTIPVGDPSVTVSVNTVTIDPADLGDSVMVDVTVTPGTFMDMSNNNYTGITNDTAWNFRTAHPGGIAPAASHDRINIYPNPCNGNFTCNVGKNTSRGELMVYNCMGEAIMKKPVTGSTINMDMSNFEKGVYFVEIKTSGKVYREKILLQ